MKGQAYILAAAIIIGALVALSIKPRTTAVTEEKKILQIKYDTYFFNHILNEYLKSVEYSYGNESQMTQNLFDFGNYTKEKAKRKGKELETFLVTIFFNKTSREFKTVSINLMNNPVSVTIEVNTTPSQTKSFNVNEYGEHVEYFSYTPGGTYNLTIEYGDKTHSLIVVTPNLYSLYVTYGDMLMSSESATHRKTFQDSYIMQD